jgi:hypothetical protein
MFKLITYQISDGQAKGNDTVLLQSDNIADVLLELNKVSIECNVTSVTLVKNQAITPINVYVVDGVVFGIAVLAQ